MYKKISDDLRSTGFTRTLEQCREKIKKLKTEYKKIKYKRDETGQGRFPEWEYFDALHEVLGHKHSTEPPVIVESLNTTTHDHKFGPDDETQDMSGVGESEATNVPSPQSSSSSTSSVTQPNTDANETQQPDSKSRERKRGKQELTNALLEQMANSKRTVKR